MARQELWARVTYLSHGPIFDKPPIRAILNREVDGFWLEQPVYCSPPGPVKVFENLT